MMYARWWGYQLWTLVPSQAIDVRDCQSKFSMSARMIPYLIDGSA
jgi:hypothetical protein